MPDLRAARGWLDRLADEVGIGKVGLELFTAEGPSAVRAVRDAGLACFLDLKLHDIPATMAGAAARAAELGVSYLTVHAAAGEQALREARAAVEGTGTRLLAVTVLTSMDADALRATGVGEAPGATVLRRARLAHGAGVHGLVCAPSDAAAIKAELPGALLMVPGIRPAGASTDDQARAGTPAAAVQAGADRLVVGRPIRNAPDPVAAARAIARAIAEVTGEEP